jgi:hypothetical protein
MSENNRVSVSVETRFGAYAACLEIPPVMLECFEPLRVSDDPMVACLAGDVFKHGREASLVVKVREDAAKRIAEALAEHLVNAMSKNDTSNGYKL